MGALSLVGMLGMTSLAVEVGSGYAAKVRNQRVADMAALGAAAAYGSANCSSVPTCTAASATANDIAIANGLPSGSTTLSAVTVGTTSGIKVAVTTSMPVRLGQVLGAAASYSVSTAAVASVGTSGATGAAGTSACVTVLGSGGTVMSATGGASVTASGCAINANGTISSDNSSAKITAKQIAAAAISDSAASWGGNAITTNPTANNIQTKANAASDSFKSVTAVQNVLCSVNKLTGQSDSDYSGGNTSCATPLVTASAQTKSNQADWALNYSPAPNVAAYRTSNNTYVIPPGNYTIGNLSLAGGITATFQGPVTLKIDAVDMSGDGMTIGDGNVTVVGTFGFNSGNTITIGNGDHNLGALTVTGGRTLRVGTGNLTVRGPITESGGSHIYVNTAAGNSVTINGDGGSPAKAIDLSNGGGSQICFTSDCSAPTAAAGTFSANGSIVTAGGSTIVFPNSGTHVIKGDLNLNGSSIFGAGLYIIAGNFTNNTGGTMTGTNVTFALGGTITLSGGTSIDLSAPSASSSYGIPDLLIATKSSAASSFGGGSQDKYGGLIYAPKSSFSASGGSSISSNGSSCMMLVVNSIAVSGSGTINSSNCASLSSSGSSSSSSSSGSPSLIQ